MLFLYREQDIRFFGLCHDPGSDDAFPNLGKSNFDSGIDIRPCLVFYSSSSVSYHEKKARVVKIPAYRATLLFRLGFLNDQATFDSDFRAIYVRDKW